MNATTTRRGRDGKNYRATPLTRQERNRARWLAHQLVHHDGLSIRAAQAQMAEAGVRRSVGTITADLNNFECPICAEHPTPERPVDTSKPTSGRTPGTRRTPPEPQGPREHPPTRQGASER